MVEGVVDTLIIEVNFGGESGQKGMEKLTETLEKLDKISKKADKSTTGFGEKLSKIAKNAADYYQHLQQITDVLGKWFKKANSYVESLNLFTVAMGKSTDAAMKYARAVEAAMGIDITEWLEYQGAFNQLAEGYGLKSKTANMMSKNLTQLAYDLSSLWNVDVSTAFLRLQSGMSGQIKGLKTWGINVSVASLKETALAHGIELSTAKMTEAQKATLRYITIMETTSKVQGDLARTIATPANALRILNAQWKQAQRAMGQVVSVIAVEVIPWFQALVMVIKDGATALADMLGYELPEINYADTLDLGTSAADAFADSLEDAEDTATKLKKSLLGIDEINVLGDKSSSSVTGLGGGYAADFGLDLSKYDYDFMKDLDTSGAKHYENIKKFLTPIGDFVKYLVEHPIDVVLMGGIPVMIGLVKKGKEFYEWLNKFDFFKTFETTRKSLKESGEGFFKSVKGGFKTAYASMSKFTKGLIGAGGMIAGMTLAKEGAYDLVKSLNTDSKDGLGGAILSLVSGGVAAVAGGFMIGGPVGALIGGGVALAGAFIGAIQASEDLRREMVNDAYMNNARTSLSELAESFKNTWDEAETLGTKSSNAMAAIEESVAKVSESRSLLQPYINKIKETGTITEEEADLMSGYVTTMVDELEYQMTTRIDSIFDTFNGFVHLAGLAFEKELGVMKADFLEFQALFGGVTAGHETEINALLGLATSQGGLDDTQRAELQKHVDALAALDITVSPEKFSFDQLVEEAAKGFNIKSVEDAQSIISDLTSKITNYQSSLNTAYENTGAHIASFLAQNEAMFLGGSIDKTQYEHFKKSFTDAQSNLDMVYDSAKDALLSDVEKVAEAIQRGALNNLGNVVKETFAGYENLNWFQKLVKGNELYNAHSDLLMANDNIIAPISDAVTQLLTEIGSNKTTWLSGKATALAESITIDQFSINGQGAESFWEFAKKVLSNYGITGYASGGFPDVGEMFVAREAGPELVGRIGNHSAVVNNEQIVEAVSDGVYRAVVTAMGENQKGNQAIYIDGRRVFEVVKSYNDRERIRTGTSPLMG